MGNYMEREGPFPSCRFIFREFLCHRNRQEMDKKEKRDYSESRKELQKLSHTPLVSSLSRSFLPPVSSSSLIHRREMGKDESPRLRFILPVRDRDKRKR